MHCHWHLLHRCIIRIVKFNCVALIKKCPLWILCAIFNCAVDVVVLLNVTAVPTTGCITWMVSSSLGNLILTHQQEQLASFFPLTLHLHSWVLEMKN